VRWTAGYDLATAAFTTYSTRPVPGSLAAAIRLLARADQDMLTVATPVTHPDGHLTLADFAAGTTSTEGGLYGPRIAALAVPLSNGTCAYVAFSSKVLTNSTSQTLAGGWLAPLRANCTGAAALVASRAYTVDPAEGG
jgi:hypothetical protein